MKICPKCNREFIDDYSICPYDQTPLIAKPKNLSGVSLNLGDANAISGGVSMSDNHSVTSNTVSNVDSHNVITNYITQVERNKSPEELRYERELAFREACKKVFCNGIITSEEMLNLQDLQYQLGIEKNIAAGIMSEESKRSERKSNNLSPVHQITFNNIKAAILANRIDLVDRLLQQMKAMVQRYSVEEIQYTYFMLLAVLHPKDCIIEYEKHFDNKYWLAFWTSIAYRRIGNIEESEILVADVGNKWSDSFPQDNVWILASVNGILDNDFESAKLLYDNIMGDHSPLLSILSTCLYTLLYGDLLDPEDLKKMQKDSIFYLVNLFKPFKRYIDDSNQGDEEREKKDALCATEPDQKLEEKRSAFEKAKFHNIELRIAGSLEKLLSNFSTEENIHISGFMDARDFNFLKMNCRNLKCLDLSQVTILSYNGRKGTDFNTFNYRANEIPLGSFFYWDPIDEGMPSLREIVLPKGITNIRRNAFARAYNLSKINIPEGVLSIDFVAFAICSTLKKIELPSSLKEVGMLAFNDCKSLSSVILNAVRPPVLGADAFNNIDSNCVLYVPRGCTQVYKRSSWSKYFKSIIEIPVQ